MKIKKSFYHQKHNICNTSKGELSALVRQAVSSGGSGFRPCCLQSECQ